MDWEAQEDGFIAKILAGDGSKDIAVGTPVLVFVEDEVSLPAGLRARPPLLHSTICKAMLCAWFPIAAHGLVGLCTWGCSSTKQLQAGSCFVSVKLLITGGFRLVVSCLS